MIAEEALRLAPASTWASHAVLGFRCAKGDWSGALAILDTNLASGLIDKAAYRRQRGVLLTARALELETLDRDLSRESAMEAIKLAPTLVPAAVLAAKYQSEAHQIRRAMRIVEAAWLAHPHPDLADAYAHVKLGDSARQRLVRVETLAAKAPGHLESALAVARAAIDASEFARAREALAPFVSRADAARGDADGGNRAHRARRQRPGAGLDLARGARAARSRLDRRRLRFATNGARCRRCPAGSMRSSGRRRWRRCRRTRPPRSTPRNSTRRCWPRRAAPRRNVGRNLGKEFASRRRRRGRAESRMPAAQDNSPAKPAASEPAPAPAPSPPPTEAVARRGRRRCSAPAPIFQKRPTSPPRQRFRLSSRSSARPTIPASTMSRGWTNSPNKSAPVAGQAGGWRGFLSRWGG